ncbi:MAG: endolytic transglycosylase MltG [Alphaproteobacteria bacterium]|nr:endolytic transglycosylase MltG [Alphaproteobacteria bacterium]
MKLKWLIGGIVVLALIALGFVAFSYQQYHAARDYIEAEKTVVIASGTGARAIIRQLHEAGVIPAPWLIALPMMLGHDATSLKAGEYQFTSGLSARDVLQKISRGEVVVHKVTIPEGWNLRQIREAFMAEPLLSGDFPAHVSEGSIFPETELFQRGESRTDVIERLQKRMRDALNDAWKKRAEDLPFATKEEALILASIIEEETGVPEERGRVAAVFVNRLRDGMMLQTDPTVVYGIEQQLGREMGRQLFKGDLQRDHPWNTYTRTGLPPTPICSPGLDSIQAALNPPHSDEYYFVAKGDGGHYFARNLREHNANVAKYKAKLKELVD